MEEKRIEKDEYGNEQIRVNTETVKCRGCGANMRFDPDKNVLVCDHCGNVQDLNDQSVAEELNFIDGINNDKKWSEDRTMMFRCDNCGAKIVLSKDETATSCPFCGTNHVQKVDDLSGLKPNAVLPFAFGKDKASEFSKKWAKKRIFAPRKFKKSLKSENLNGIYTPCFTFDSVTTSVYSGRIGKTRTRTVGSGKNRRTQTYTVWRNISGTFYKNFDDILITAGKKCNQKTVDKLSPYPTNDSKEFNEKYLLGFMAYQYDEELTECWSDAKSKMDVILRKKILDQYDHDRVAYLNVSTTHEHVTYKYVMLPVYVGNFNFKRKLYNFFVNGTSGKVTGKTPVSFWRVLLAVILGLAVVGGIGYLLYSLGVFDELLAEGVNLLDF